MYRELAASLLMDSSLDIMKRKVYTTDRERKSDQLLGAIAFPLINTVLWLMTDRLLEPRAQALLYRSVNDPIMARIRLLPWIVNGLILILAFLFRPEIGVGYIASIFFIMCASVVLGAVFVATCLVSSPMLCVPLVGPVLFLAVFWYVALYLAGKAFGAFQIWWSPSWDTEEKSTEEAQMSNTKTILE